MLLVGVFLQPLDEALIFELAENDSVGVVLFSCVQSKLPICRIRLGRGVVQLALFPAQSNIRRHSQVVSAAILRQVYVMIAIPFSMKQLADSVSESMMGAMSLMPALVGTAWFLSLPVPSERRKQFFLCASFCVILMISSMTSFDGLLRPTPPSSSEQLWLALTFLISAEGKQMGAAEVALAMSFMQKSWFLSKMEWMERKMTSSLVQRLTALTTTLVSFSTSDSFTSLKYPSSMSSYPFMSYFVSNRLTMLPKWVFLKITSPQISKICMRSCVEQMGVQPSCVPVLASASTPPMLVPPMQSNILCRGLPTLRAMQSRLVAIRSPLVPPPSRLKPILQQSSFFWRLLLSGSQRSSSSMLERDLLTELLLRWFLSQLGRGWLECTTSILLFCVSFRKCADSMDWSVWRLTSTMLLLAERQLTKDSKSRMFLILNSISMILTVSWQRKSSMQSLRQSSWKLYRVSWYIFTLWICSLKKHSSSLLISFPLKSNSYNLGNFTRHSKSLLKYSWLFLRLLLRPTKARL